MKKLIQPNKNIVTFGVALALAALLGANHSAKAQLVTYEGFNYTPTATLAGQSGGTGWGLNWSIDGSGAANGIIGSTSLSNSISLATGGQSVTIGNGTIYARQLASTLGTPGSATIVWVSILFLGGSSASPNESRIGFYGGVGDGTVVDGNTTTSSSGLPNPVDVGRAATGADEISLYKSTTINSTGVAVPRGSTNAALLLLKFDMDGTAANDTVSLWVNPDLSLGAGGLGTAQATWNSADLDVINGIRLQAGNAGSFSVDEIRIGDTFADVTPLAAVSAPTIQASLSGGNVNLSWSLSASAGFNLQSATNLAPPVTWNDFAPALATNSDTVSTVLPATNSQAFFRLKK